MLKLTNCYRRLTRTLLLSLAAVFSIHFVIAQSATTRPQPPKIVNIINFIRLLEPRDSAITEDVLYQTVVQQVQLLQQYKLPGTFLLQYDALMNPRYQQLLKALPADSFEIGAWWEIPQPLAERAGLQWRGRYPWDWHANVGFATGYTPVEREKIADVYMNDFKKIFGYYPKSVASWFIDAHTLNYLYNKYQIVASANCKDQIGTDGYTLWGGYWNQAYYPSKLNSYMPAQTEKNQTPVPIFRMLGSDPIRQYDARGNGNGQGVVTLEPVYQYGGGDSAWVNWYFREFTTGQCMAYGYVQTGQENSFTWDAMQKGFRLQIPLIARLRNEALVRVETLASSGEWFRKNYSLTPPTSVTIQHDMDGSNKKTVWFNSRFYRVNLLWENNTLRFRDIHLFNEQFPSYYTEHVTTTNECSFFTLPFLDGFQWSTADKTAGLRLKAVVNGKEILLEGGNPIIKDNVPGQLYIEWPLTSITGKLKMTINESGLLIHLQNKQSLQWYLDLTTANQIKLPFVAIQPKKVTCRFQDMNYHVSLNKGLFSQPDTGTVIRIQPQKDEISLSFNNL